MEQIRTEELDPQEEEESRRPEGDPYMQQSMRAWSPYITPKKAIWGYVIIGLVFIPLGIILGINSADVVELRNEYDSGSDADECHIEEYNQNKTCTVSFDVGKDMPGPVYVYYELSNFYQNHATYVDSVVDSQLEGSISTSSLDDCSPLQYNGTLQLHPCGLVANTLFNDIIELTDGGNMSETGIAWETDVDTKFVQPDGFASAVCESSEDCATCLSEDGATDSSGDTLFDGCGLWDSSDGTTYAYYYPDEDDTQYLYETFPQVINPIEGVTNEHFIVWMRTSGLHKFRKLYGRIEDGVSSGDTLTFTINANYVTTFFDGTKSLVVSTTNDLGGQNPYWGQSLVTLGVAIWVLAALGAVKEFCWQRVMGDLTKLVDDYE